MRAPEAIERWSQPATESEIACMKEAAVSRDPVRMFRWLNFAIEIFEAMQERKAEDD